jgi:hypothetical protein
MFIKPKLYIRRIIIFQNISFFEFFIIFFIEVNVSTHLFKKRVLTLAFFHRSFIYLSLFSLTLRLEKCFIFLIIINHFHGSQSIHFYDNRAAKQLYLIKCVCMNMCVCIVRKFSFQNRIRDDTSYFQANLLHQ